VASEAGRRAVSEAYRRTSIARRDGPSVNAKAGLRALERELRLRRIAFPHPSRCSGSCDPLDLDTVAGAAPALDESAPDFPFNRSPARGHSLRPCALERTPHAAQSLLRDLARRQEPHTRRSRA